jgi:phage terminase Nu1 subunit (DNA packaging protein)
VTEPSKPIQADSEGLPASVDVHGLAELLVLKVRRVQDLAAMGVVAKSAVRGLYDTKASIQGYVQFLRQSKTQPVTDGAGRTLDLEAEKYRLTKAKADREEMLAAELKGELIKRAQVEEAWQEMLGMFRTRILEVPTAIAPDLYNTETIGQITQILRETLYDVLKSLTAAGIETEECLPGPDSNG